jgi:hypothetical protein
MGNVTVVKAMRLVSALCKYTDLAWASRSLATASFLYLGSDWISSLSHSYTYGCDSNDLDRIALHQEKHICVAQSGSEEAATLDRMSLK